MVRHGTRYCKGMTAGWAGGETGAETMTKHANRKPQGGVHAYLIDRGRVWVESINSLKGTALVRFDCKTGIRSRARTVKLVEIDFTREWKF